jgi:hypothetical protein
LSAAPKLIEDLEAEMASRNADRDLVTDEGVAPRS